MSILNNLSAEERAYLEQNYSPQEIEEAVKRVEGQAPASPGVQSVSPGVPVPVPSGPAPAGNPAMRSVSHSIYAGANPDNLVKWQLDVSADLERIEHLLKGDIIKHDEKGNIYWETPTDERFKVFNAYGVGRIMNFLSSYLMPNTLLSNYAEADIKEKMYNLGIEFSDFLLLNADELGMDNPNRRKMYPIICRQVIDIIHSAYNRSINGGERSSIRTIMQINQNDNPSAMPMQMYNMEKRSIVNPMRYLGGKYK